MTTKHTPGPWKWYWRKEEGEANCGVFWEKREGQAISVCRAPRYEKQEQWETNAALISAAPDLADALERTVNALDLVLRQKPLRDATETFAEARAALEKAGRQ
jgi:hypothetical protein